MLQLDVTGALAKIITPSLGITDQEFSTTTHTLRHTLEDVLRERKQGKHAWAQSPYDEKTSELVQTLAARVHGERIETILWVGIGGSSLGPRVIREVFERAETPELVVLDTVDPSILQEELKLIDWRRTLLVIASKSGGTVEPMSLFFLLHDQLHAALGEQAPSHIVAITDPSEGVLHDLAVKEGFLLLPIPPTIDGRYSIFTPIGLLPLALLKGDIDGFLRGARDMDVLCQQPEVRENPATLLAATQFLLDAKHQYPIRVIMPYSMRLQSLGRWEQQLLSESLGKTEAYGPFPLASIGTQDQHSMLQQWIQGRRLVWFLFIREEEKAQLTVPEVAEPSLSYLSGKGFGQILDALYEGTVRSLTAAKRPHVTITLPRLDAYHLGQLFFLFLMEVVLLAKLYRVNPYGQPGVELGKKIAKEILSRGK
jgi:glucose-6-phosphate isomerase